MTVGTTNAGTAAAVAVEGAAPQGGAEALLGWAPGAADGGSVSQDRWESALRDFGHARFRPGQREVLARVFAGRSALAIFPTGGGKSLCYQLPAKLLPGLVVVVSPLIALMKDQVDGLESVEGLRVARLDGTLERDEVQAVYDRLYDRELDLLYVAPERFQNERFKRALGRARLALFCLDEAHCVSEWGHSFRPDYLRLESLARGLRCPVLGLTATATPRVRRDVAEAFGIAPEDVICTGFRRPNLALSVRLADAGDRVDAVEAVLREADLPAVCYTTRRVDAEVLAGALAERGLRAEAYHAGLDRDARASVQGRFMDGAIEVVCATIAFGMGIDKADLRTVVHVRLPRSIEGYYQEVGRAGRDGAPARAVLLANGADEPVLRNYALGKMPAPEELRGVVRALCEQGSGPGAVWIVGPHLFGNRFDVDSLVVRTLLARMELAGEIEALTAFFAERRWPLAADTEQVAARFDPARADFLRSVFQAARVGRIWATLDLLAASEALGEPVDRIERALRYLDDKGWLEVRAQRPHERYRVCRPLDPEAVLARELSGFERTFRAQADKVSEVLAYAQARDRCRTEALLAYFGETLEGGCGSCDVCRGEAPEVPAHRPPPFHDADRAALAELLASRAPAVTARKAARILCAVWSPGMRSWQRTPWWGRFRGRDFDTVLAWIEGGSAS